MKYPRYEINTQNSSDRYEKPFKWLFCISLYLDITKYCKSLCKYNLQKATHNISTQYIATTKVSQYTHKK